MHASVDANSVDLRKLDARQFDFVICTLICLFVSHKFLLSNRPDQWLTTSKELCHVSTWVLTFDPCFHGCHRSCPVVDVGQSVLSFV